MHFLLEEKWAVGIDIYWTLFLKTCSLAMNEKYLKSYSHLINLKNYLLSIILNAFYFISTALFVLNIFRFLSRLSGYVEKTAWLEI